MKKSKKNNKNNSKVETVRLPFFERQVLDDTCRLYAINNALGRSILSRKTYDHFQFKIPLLCFSFLVSRFLGYCDEFDKQHHCQGSRKFFFIHSNDNIISFILNKFHVRSSYYTPDNPPNVR